MLTCAIVDDEKLAIERLERLIEQVSKESSEVIKILFKASSCKELEKQLKNHSPDVLFLDIHLVDTLVFDALDKIEYEPYIVFVTAHDDYTIKAFEEGAIDYILKPYTKERIEKTIHRILKSYRKNQQLRSDENINKQPSASHTLEYLKTKLKTKKLPIKLEDDIVLLPISEIIYIEADNKDVIIVTKEGRYRAQFHMYNLEVKLRDDGFIRIHKSYLISVNHISRIKKWFAGSYLVEMSNGDELKISRNYQREFLDLINYH